MAQTSQNWLNNILTTLFLVLLVATFGALLYYILSPTQTAVDRRSTIDVRGEATVLTHPDRATVTFEITTNGATAAQADALNQQKSMQLAEMLDQKLQKQDRFETVNYSVYPRYETINDERREVGQTASQSIQVTFNGLVPSDNRNTNNPASLSSGIERVGEIISLGLNSGATGVSGPQFSVSENNLARSEARALSVKVAEKRANELAKQAGVTLRALHYIKDQDYTPVVFARNESALKSAVAMSNSVSSIVAPEETSISHSIEASYYIS